MSLYSLLLPVLFCSLICGVIALITLSAKKKDDKRYEKISAIATFMAAVGSIVVGIITVTVMKHQEDAERLLNQPLFAVHVGLNYSQDKQLYDNEEYVIENVGYKTRSKTDVNHYSIIEVSRFDNAVGKVVTKYCLMNNYFGASFTTGNLDGTVEYSSYSKNNNELFFNLYSETLHYGETHPGVYVDVKKKHYFVLVYTDIYGDIHTIVKNEDKDVDPDQFKDILKRTNTDCGGRSFDIQKLNLDVIMETCFK